MFFYMIFFNFEPNNCIQLYNLCYIYYCVLLHIYGFCSRNKILQYFSRRFSGHRPSRSALLGPSDRPPIPRSVQPSAPALRCDALRPRVTGQTLVDDLLQSGDLLLPFTADRFFHFSGFIFGPVKIVIGFACEQCKV